MISIRFGAVRTSSQVKRKKSHRRYAKMHIACVFILIEEKTPNWGEQMWNRIK